MFVSQVFNAVPKARLFSNVHNSNVTLWLSCKNTAPPRPTEVQLTAVKL